jgi:hypothetical protein
MKKRLREHLRSTLDFSQLELNPDDLLEPLPNDYYDSRIQASKRQRVEKVATDYLRRGQPPVLLSSRLRGPFNGKWINPWKGEVKGETTQKIPDISDRRGSEKPNGERKGISTRLGTVAPGALQKDREELCRLDRSKEPVHRTTKRTPTKDGAAVAKPGLSGKKQTTHTPRVAPREESPMARKGVTIHGDWDGSQQSCTSNNWLRRRPSDVGRRVSDTIDHARSPTPPRDGGTTIYAPVIVEKYTTLAPSPAAPIHGPPLQVLGGQWRSSASASMAISSPASQAPFRALETLKDKSNVYTSGRGIEWKRDEASANNTHSGATLSRGDVQSMARRSVAVSSSLVKKPKETTTSRDRTNRGDKPPVDVDDQLQHASPLPSSFQYTRIRRTATGGQKARPRPMTFESPPVFHDGVPKAVNNEAPTRNPPTGYQKAGGRGATEDSRGDGAVHVGVQTLLSDKDAMTEGPRGEDKVESQTSMYSTQAAMRLVQLQFQDGSFLSPLSSSASDTPRPREVGNSQQSRQSHHSQRGPHTNTPRREMRASSPAITPFHAFNAELDKSHPEQDPAGLLISTQDLFLAASPFAFSTARKKPAAPPKRSSLRFAVLSQEEERDGTADAPRDKSPTPSGERVPFKVRNSMVSFKLASPKGSQESWKRSLSRPRTSELPQLDFAPSTGDMSFADQFLRNLDELM